LSRVEVCQLKGELYSNHPIAKYNSWGIGGTVKRFYKPYDLEDCINFVKSLKETERVIWLGLGSNVLFPDGVLDATVISTRFALKGVSLLDSGFVKVFGGETCSKLARFSAKLGLGSAAFFAGIPGTVGGALAMNAGAFGAETWDYVESVTILNQDGFLKDYKKSDFKIGYRSVSGPVGLFVSAIFKFKPMFVNDANLVIKSLLKKRGSSQPIGTLNCGSVFRNPPGDYAARLIESLGLKGYRIGGAEISKVHANFILNCDFATSQNVVDLINFIKQKVFDRYQINLVPEVKIIS
jgi:UDP-N-acetylmuramate dehydrogenase